MDTFNRQLIFGSDGFALPAVFVPDAKTRWQTTDVRLGRSAGSKPGVKAESHAPAGNLLPKGAKLVQGSRIELYAFFIQAGEVRCQFLGA